MAENLSENKNFNMKNFEDEVKNKVETINGNLNAWDKKTNKETKGKEKCINMVKELMNTRKWIEDYIEGMTNYQKNAIKNKKFTSKYLAFLEDMDKKCKENRKKIDEEIEKLKNEINGENKSETDKKEQLDSIEQIKEQIKNKYKNDNRRYKNAAGKENVWRIETLAHNLSYTKNGKNVENSNKIGFLDYLEYLTKNPAKEKEKEIRKKLRYPFEKVTINSKLKDVQKYVKKVMDPLKEAKINDAKIFEIAKKILENKIKRINKIIKGKIPTTMAISDQHEAKKLGDTIMYETTDYDYPRRYSDLFWTGHWPEMHRIIRKNVRLEILIDILKKDIPTTIKTIIVERLTRKDSDYEIITNLDRRNEL
jgi:hypothetical protein